MLYGERKGAPVATWVALLLAATAAYGGQSGNDSASAAGTAAYEITEFKTKTYSFVSIPWSGQYPGNVVGRQVSMDGSWALEHGPMDEREEEASEVRVVDSAGHVLWQRIVGSNCMLSTSQMAFMAHSDYGGAATLYNIELSPDPVYVLDGGVLQEIQSLDGSAFALLTRSSSHQSLELVTVQGKHLASISFADTIDIHCLAVSDSGRYVVVGVTESLDRFMIAKPFPFSTSQRVARPSPTGPRQREIYLFRQNGQAVATIPLPNDRSFPRATALSPNDPPLIAVATDMTVMLMDVSKGVLWVDSIGSARRLPKVLVLHASADSTLYALTGFSPNTNFWSWDSKGRLVACLQLPSEFEAGLATRISAPSPQDITIENDHQVLRLRSTR